jgi:integrase
MADNKGRKRGSRNKGYFYRAGRGWSAKTKAGKFKRLKDENGKPLTDPNLPEAVVKLAHARFLLTAPAQSATGSGVTLLEVCDSYLAYARHNGAAANTVECRADTLFDLCFGLPPRFRPGRKHKPTATDKIHGGLGGMAVADLKPHHIESWMAAHAGWTPSGNRTRIQAVKRALNRAVKSGLIASNPLRGMEMPKGRARISYIDQIQEAALLKHSSPALRIALKVLLRTGMRCGCEFGKLTASHVTDHGDKIEIQFKPAESKNRKKRTVRISDPEILAMIRKAMKEHPQGAIFRSNSGKPWVTRQMSLCFRRTKARAEAAGTKFEPDTVLYATRHTFAKRCLTGFWTGKPTSIQVLAQLMGNTPKVCQDNYLQWTSNFDAPLWEAC